MKDSEKSPFLENIRAEMDKAKVQQEVRWMVEQFVSVAIDEGNRLNLAEKTVVESIEIFRKFMNGHRLVPETPDEVWVQAKNGRITVGDTVRVRSDAYSVEADSKHNGRIGRIVAIRYGDVHVRYYPLDGEKMSAATRHRAEYLEKRIQ